VTRIRRKPGTTAIREKPRRARLEPLEESPVGPGFGTRVLKLVQKGAYASALPLLRRALEAPPPVDELAFALARAHFHLGDVHAAVQGLRRLARSPNAEVRRRARGKIAVYIPGDPHAGNAQILKDRRRWALLESKVEPPRHTAKAPRRDPGRKIRVGYVSAFFPARNWMKPIWPLLAAHDRQSFEIHLFLDRGQPDPRQGFVHNPADRVHALDGLTNEAAGRLVAATRVDILVDLNGYSYPSRLGLFMRKAAPVQVGMFNHYATSGVGGFDYLVADHTVLPAGQPTFCSEKVLRVTGSYLAFTVAYRVPKVAPPPCNGSSWFTFGCLAPQYKINEGVIATFAAILRAAPRARLILKNTCMADAANRAEVRGRFLRHGISREQLVCEGPAEHFAFLRAYDRIDVALDAFPYGGGTTTMEALWQGVPVLAFLGDRWAARISASLLRAAGLGEWVCPSRESFVRRAVATAQSPEVHARLSSLRPVLRDKIRTSPASDVQNLCRQLETHYRAVTGSPARRGSSVQAGSLEPLTEAGARGPGNPGTGRTGVNRPSPL
jgi:protein O-GlcNAc transferase